MSDSVPVKEAFDVNQYWLKRGQNYIRENFPDEFHRLQEKFLLDVLRASEVPMKRILEIGCGFGRITKLLAGAFPEAHITALDLSPSQLENARQYCGNNPNISFLQYDFYSGAPFPGTNYDMAVAIEVFLHHPPNIVLSLFEKLSAVAQHLVNIDWSEEWPWKTAEHVWVHDYRALYARAGMQCATFVLPQKIEGMQQKLFIAGKQLGPTLRRHEEERETVRRVATAAAPDSVGEMALWPERLQGAIRELRESIPSGSTLVLVNEDQWGNEARLLEGYRLFPFLERDGKYWGPPPDDRTALLELERLRLAGATHVAFAWSSFWWLEHYAGLREYLRHSCVTIRDSDSVVIFRLPT